MTRNVWNCDGIFLCDSIFYCSLHNFVWFILREKKKKKTLTLEVRQICQKYAAAAAKLLQSCPTLCDPIDGSPPGSSVLGILQARTLEWVAISFSNVWKWKVKVKSLSHVRLLATPWTAAHQAPLSKGFFQARILEWSAIAFSSRKYIQYIQSQKAEQNFSISAHPGTQHLPTRPFSPIVYRSERYCD